MLIMTEAAHQAASDLALELAASGRYADTGEAMDAIERHLGPAVDRVVSGVNILRDGWPDLERIVIDAIGCIRLALLSDGAMDPTSVH
ncbi:hypothetical protein [Qipengyuania gaetbuli]|uniref:hypothetical protein n=1 Tax=Qipengyuania gaetbuli TaxID=266952 RepID=UPI001CFF3402|nr:hypothetical protein [Qipengyuania gaetbuli]